MNKKEVIFFIDSLGGGGAERVLSVLSNDLVERDYDVSVVMLWKRDFAYTLNEKVNTLFAEDLPVTSFYGKLTRKSFNTWMKFRRRIYVPICRRLGFGAKLPKWNETFFYFYAIYAMPYREYMKKHNGATAFGFLIRSNIAMLMAAKGTKIKTVFCERNNPVRPDMPKNIMKLRDKLCKKCNEAVFQTYEQKDYYAKIKGKKTVIPNAIKDGLPERFQGERRPEIVNFCRLSKQKNLPLLIDAFEMILKEYPEYTLKIYGKGEEKENLIKYINDKNLQDKVYLNDFAEDIHYKIRDAKMFVSTSDFEGLSNTMIEAMAIGMPCVCTDCDGGGARMMIKDYENGLLVPKGDLNAVCSAMKEVIDDKHLSEKLSINATKVKDNLKASIITEKWIEMI